MNITYKNDISVDEVNAIRKSMGWRQDNPEYHNKGIEKELITKMLDFLHERLKPGFGIQVDIRAFDDQESLYESLGFQISTIERRGIPMHICLTNQIELTDKMFKQMDCKEE